MRAVSVFLNASNSLISTSLTHCNNSLASLPSKVRMPSLNQPLLILSKNVDLSIPCCPARISIMSYLHPGSIALATAAVNALLVTALIYGLYAAPRESISKVSSRNCPSHFN